MALLVWKTANWIHQVYEIKLRGQQNTMYKQAQLYSYIKWTSLILFQYKFNMEIVIFKQKNKFQFIRIKVNDNEILTRQNENKLYLWSS